MNFLYPDVFYMMLIPLILLIVLVLTSKNNMDKYFSKEILSKLTVGGKVLDKNTRNGLLFITLILFIIALGRPVVDKKEQDIKQKLIPIVVALDVSKSMMATDIYPNRISLAIQKLKEIIKLSQNTTIGVLLFAKDSFVLSPVTEDFISLKYIANNIDTRLNFPNGSNIFATLEATAYMLEDFGAKNMIILSDGGNSKDYVKEIEYANDKNIAIYSIGLATTKGAPIPSKEGYLTNDNGDIVTVRLNESIKNLSLETKGGYIDFSLDNSDVKAILKRINTQSKKEELSVEKFKTYTELFYYPLGLGLFVLLLALSSIPSRIFKKNVFTAILLSFIYFIPTQTKAEIFEFKNIENANKFYKDKKYKEASDEYRKLSKTPQSFYDLGNALYKDGKYKEALDIYSKVVTDEDTLEAKKLHNIGNSYVKLNNLEKAKEFYEKALKVKEDKETRENLDIVNKELKKQKKQEQKENEQEKQDKNKQENQQNKKNQQDKEKQNQESKKEQQENQDEKKEKKQGKKEQSQSKQSQQTQSGVKKEEMSDMEEKKWMKLLEGGNTPILLRKADTKKESKVDETQPW